MLVYKDGITRTILTDEWRKFEEIGYIQVEEIPREAKEEAEEMLQEATPKRNRKGN